MRIAITRRYHHQHQLKGGEPQLMLALSANITYLNVLAEDTNSETATGR